MLWRSGLPCQEVALTPRLFLESGDSETSSSGIFEMAIYRKRDFSGTSFYLPRPPGPEELTENPTLQAFVREAG
jgi:hypothetical protein